MKPRPDITIGDLLEWQGVPVLVLSEPRQGSGVHVGKWVSRVIYIRMSNAFCCPQGTTVPLPSFNLNDKQRWTGPLTDEEEARIMRWLLLDA